MSGDLRRDFGSREELAAYLREQFPDAAARGCDLAPTRGGRREALRRLAAVPPARHAASRSAAKGIQSGVRSVATISVNPAARRSAT